MVEFIVGLTVARYARLFGGRTWPLTIGWFFVGILTYGILCSPLYYLWTSRQLLQTGLVLAGLAYLRLAWFSYRRCLEGIDYYAIDEINVDLSVSQAEAVQPRLEAEEPAVGGRSIFLATAPRSDTAEKRSSQPVPAWGWLFVVACGSIPFLLLGRAPGGGILDATTVLGWAVHGAISGGIGFTGAGACKRIARDSSKTVARRVAICADITFICWLLIITYVYNWL